MKASSLQSQRVLAVDPYDRGFGYALLGGPNDLLDWGITAADRRTATRYLPSLEKLVNRFAPDILVTEDGARQGSSRRRETRLLLKRIRRFAKRHRVRVRTYSRAAVEDTFVLVGASKNKHQMATAIAGWFPELAARLPKPQKPWTGENRSMNVFDAVSFALTFFHKENYCLLTARRSPQPSLSAGMTGSVSPGYDQDQEDARRLSFPISALPSSRPEKIPPTNI